MPDNETTYRELVAKYLAKELSANEEATLQQWLDGNAANKQFLTEAEALWKYSGKKFYLADTATEQEWQRLLKSIEINKTGSSMQHRTISLYWKIAASVIMAVGLGYFISLNWPTQQQTETEQYTTYQTTDSPDIFYLPDSSKIRLSVNSKLIFLSSFDPRMVQLEGEGFFEVQHNSQHLFSVNAGNTVTQVIGTSFNLRAYGNEETVELVLVSGKVKFADSNGKHVTMSAGEKTIYNKKEHTLITETIEPNVSTEKSSDDAVENEPADEPVKEKRKKEKKEVVKEEKKPSPEELAMERERGYPAEYLTHTFSWKKNLLNQTIIEGTVTNTAAYTSYTNIQLKIKLTASNGQPLEKDVNILGLKNIEPGATMPFKVSLTEAVQDETTPVIEIIGAKSVK